MSDSSAVLTKPPTKLDYSLTGENSTRAIERGLAEAEWYQCPVPRETMRKLLERKDGPALRDTAIWFALILGSGYATYALWGRWWAAIPYSFYAVLYASTSDSRWHEAGHGTAFKTDWMNNVLYEIASFMVMRESTVWRWSHTRHHSDTIIVGRDPEIAVPRPPDIFGIVINSFSVKNYLPYFKKILLHASGQMLADERTYISESEFPKIHRRARIYLRSIHPSPSTSPPATTCNSTFRPTTKSASAISTFQSPSPPSGNSNTSSTSSPAIPRLHGATTTRSPATGRPSAPCVSTSASRPRHPARIALPASAAATFFRSNPATRLPPSARLATSTSNPRNAK